MAKEIQVPSTSGAVLYAVILDSSGANLGKAWNGAAFEVPASANWATYPVVLAEQGATGVYEGDMPALPAALYTVTAYRRAGGTPVVGDAIVGLGSIDWTGTAVATVASRSAYAGGPVASVAAPVTVNAVNGLAPPTNWNLTAVDGSGRVTVGTNNDKAGYGLSAAAVQAIWDTLLSALTTVGSVGKKLADWVLGTDNKALLSTATHTGAVIPTVTDVTTKTGYTLAASQSFNNTGQTTKYAATLAAGDVSGNLPSAPADGSIKTATFATGATMPRVTLCDTITTYTGDTPQTGDAYPRIGVNGAGLSALAPAATALSTAQWTGARATKLDFLAGDTFNRIGPAGANLTALGDARLAHLDADISSVAGGGSGADPWAVFLPGSYGVGTAGAILGTNLDVAVGTRSTLTGPAVWTTARGGNQPTGSFGAFIDAAISSLGGGGGSGSGEDVPVDHNYGGADALAYRDAGGTGIDNARIAVYLKDDYDAGRRGREFIRGRAETDVAGRWTHPIFLDPGTYFVVFYKQGAYQVSLAEVVVAV